MVPSAFVVLDALPVTPNGKIDRSKLPGPKQVLNDVAVAPWTEIDGLVAQIWRDVLKVETIGVHDNFFELGGHSLLAIQIISRVREAFDKEVALIALFEAPTVAGLARKIEKAISGISHDLPPIVRVPRDGPLPLSMNQEHLWRLDRMIPGTHFFNMPYVYQLSGDLNVQALEKALKEIVRRHEALRTVFPEVDGRPVQVINKIPDFRLPYMDLRGEYADEVSQTAASVIFEEREGPFDLASGPLLRIRLLRLTDTDYLLLITMHHIIGDYWSMQLFWTELATLYVTVSQAQASPLADPVIQFAEYACWERQLLDNGLLDGQLAYWKSQLAGPLPQLELKKAGKVPKVPSFRTSRQTLEFDESLYSGIKFLARKEHCTPFMVLVAALSIALHHQTGQQDIRIGTLVANRSQRESGRVIGHFLNTVILRTRLFPDMTCKCVLKLVREVTLAAYANEELPFEQLARVLQEEQNIMPSSLFHVFLTYQRSTFQSHKLPGVTFASLGGQLPFMGPELLPTAFDLIVNVRETSTKFTGSVNYKVDAINADDVHIMCESLFAVIQSLVSNTERLVSGIHFDARLPR
jgi:acyl carrier protein